MATQNLLKTLDKIPELKVIVLGDVMLDIYDFCYSKHSRPSPEKPDKKVYTASKSLVTLGGAGNVASNLSDMGVSTVLISVCGKDGHYFKLQELAEDKNIHHFFLRDKERVTTQKTRFYIDDEYILRKDEENKEDLRSEIAATAYTEFLRELKGADAVIISDYAKGFFTAQNGPNYIKACKERNIPVIVDFKPKNIDLFQGATAIGPNLVESKQLEPSFVDEFNPIDPLSTKAPILKLYERLNSDNLFVTLGSHGTCAYDGKDLIHKFGYDVNVVDTVGAGDTVRAGLALGLACGLNISDALELGNIAAAVAIQKLGTATASCDEIKDFINSNSSETLLAAN